MHFTQEDYIKIEKWLHRNSVKDSEFQEALPFTGKEIVTVVQDGHNRKVNIQEFINQLYKHGVEDFLNVTNTYRANNITLKEAIRLIPSEARKEGQVITFLNTDGNWEIYQFIGKLNQWNNPTLWNNPFDWEKLIVNSILPDEEDLTKSAPDANGNAYLSLKDRKYEPDKYSGLGRKILRRRVVEIEDPVYGTQEKNLLLQADFVEDNTVYVVRYDFTLNGVDITLPDNSYIEYEGGSISDGNIIDRAGGLSRVVIKKNIINGKSILTQEMISKPNTIYEIRYDFDLNEKEITIPEDCVLDFQGGNIINGTLILENTEFQNLIKLTNIILEGQCKNPILSLDWFEDSISLNYSANLQSLVTIALKQSIINIGCKNYIIDNTVLVDKPLTIQGNSVKGYSMLEISNYNSTLQTTKDIPIFKITSSLVSISGVNFIGAFKDVDTTLGVRNANNPLVLFENARNAKIQNCNFSCAAIGLHLKTSGISIIESNNFSECNCGCWMQTSPDSNIINNYFNTNLSGVPFNKDNISDKNGIGLLLQSSSGNSNIIGGKVEWNTKGIVISNSMGVTITGVQFDVNRQGNLFYEQSYMSPDSSLLGHTINGCRFLGGNQSQHIYIKYWSESKFNITGNFFTKNGDTAIDISNDGNVGPDTILKVVENHLDDNYQYNCNIKFTENSYHRISNLIDSVTQSKNSTLVNILTDTLDLNYIGEYTIRKDTCNMKIYTETFEGIGITLQKYGNIIIGRIYGTASSDIINHNIIANTMSVKALATLPLWQPIGTNNYENLIQTFRDEDRLLISIKKDTSIDFTFSYFSNLM